MERKRSLPNSAWQPKNPPAGLQPPAPSAGEWFGQLLAAIVHIRFRGPSPCIPEDRLILEDFNLF
jgi:hypothetical protein